MYRHWGELGLLGILRSGAQRHHHGVALGALADEDDRLGNGKARFRQAYHLQRLAGRQDEAAQSLAAARQLRELRSLSQGYCPPGHACRSYRALFQALWQLDCRATPLVARLATLEAAPPPPAEGDANGACGAHGR